jgi:hypothetical protein
VQRQHGFVTARALHFDGEERERIRGKRRRCPWWRKGKRGAAAAAVLVEQKQKEKGGCDLGDREEVVAAFCM